MSVEPIPTVDGRRARRDQNRERVVDALLELYREGDLQPSVALVAERSGVSHRSVFRYFDDLDELYRVAIDRQLANLADRWLIPDLGEGPIEDRITTIVDRRLQIFETEGSVARVGHMLAPTQPIIARNMERMAAESAKQVARHFAPELDALPDAGRPAVHEAATAILSMESLEFLRHIRGLSSAEAGNAVRAVLRGLLEPSR